MNRLKKSIEKLKCLQHCKANSAVLNTRIQHTDYVYYLPSAFSTFLTSVQTCASILRVILGKVA